MSAPITMRRGFQSKTIWGLGFIAFGLLAAAVAFLFVGAVLVFGESAQAEVVDLEYGRRGTCAPVLVYSAEGSERRATPNIKTSPCPWAKGDRTKVYFFADTPDRPRTASFWEIVGPFVPSAVLLVIGFVMLLRKPRASEILENAPAVTADRVSTVGRQIVRVRGTLQARGPLLSAPFTARQCIAYWARVSRKSLEGRLTEVATTSKSTALSVRDESGSVDFAAGVRLRLKVTAERSGDSTGADQMAAIERFVDALGARAQIADLGTDDLVWYEAAFVDGDAVEVAGWAKATLQGATLEPIEHGVVFSRL